MFELEPIVAPEPTAPAKIQAHIFCGECAEAPATFVCGTPLLSNDDHRVGPLKADEEPCPVCFAAETIVCNTCGTEIACQ